MTIHRLKLFAAIVRHKSITLAANEFKMPQPAVSRHLKNLESEIGVQLIIREHGRLDVTKAGYKLFDDIQPILHQYLSLEDNYIRKTAKPDGGKILTLAGNRGTSVWPLPILMCAFQKQHPSIQMSLLTDTSQEIEKMILNRRVDVALIFAPSNFEAIMYEPYCSNRVLLVIAKHHPLASVKHLVLKDLNCMSLLVSEGRDKERYTERTLKTLLPGIEWNVVMSFEHLAGLKTAIESGMGVGVVFDHMVCDELRSGVFKLLPLKITNGLGLNYIAYSKSDVLPNDVKHFIEFLHEKRESLRNLRPATLSQRGVKRIVNL